MENCDSQTIPAFSLEVLLDTLKTYQRETMGALIKENGEEEAAKIWLAANGPSSTQQFGGDPADPKPFWDRFYDEFRKFICGDKKYKKERDELLSKSAPTAILLVSTISSLIATTLGLAAALVTPVVAVLLHTVGKIGITAWCAV